MHKWPINSITVLYGGIILNMSFMTNFYRNGRIKQACSRKRYKLLWWFVYLPSCYDLQKNLGHVQAHRLTHVFYFLIGVFLVEIPGFYYDEEKKKYFRITKDHPKKSFGKDVKKQKQVEKQQQKEQVYQYGNCNHIIINYNWSSNGEKVLLSEEALRYV